MRVALRYMNWLYNPLHDLDASGIYDLLSTSSPTEHRLYLNLGYWRQAASFDEASDALALLVGETARMGAGDVVLDCGFGFGDQDMLWAQRLKPERIIGLNVTASQVAVAQRRIAEIGFAERVELRHASATEMPIASDSVDKVLALESAFHFCTRERFFREAYRVLRPGGRLVTADIIPMPAVSGITARLQHRISWALMARKFAIPTENAYTRPVYESRLEASGFEQIQVESIRDMVYAPLHRYVTENPGILKHLHPMVRLPARLALRFRASTLYRGLDYVLATAVKCRNRPYS